jgi:hypothetical protein
MGVKYWIVVENGVERHIFKREEVKALPLGTKVRCVTECRSCAVDMDIDDDEPDDKDGRPYATTLYCEHCTECFRS